MNWKPIPLPPFNERYEVSDHGTVRRIPGFDDGRRRWREGGMKLSKGHYGYPVVTLYKNGICKQFGVHRLVALTFLPRGDWFFNSPLHEVNHIDSNPSNSHISNLEWVTPSENQRHSLTSGRKTRGERHHKSKLNTAQVLSLRALRDSGMSLPKLAKRFGISTAAVWYIVTRHAWAHV